MTEAEFLAFHAERDRAAFLHQDAGRAVARNLRGRGLEMVPAEVVDHLVSTYGQLRLRFLRSGKAKFANAPVEILRQTVRDTARCSRCGEVDRRVFSGAEPRRVDGNLVCADCLP